MSGSKHSGGSLCATLIVSAWLFFCGTTEAQDTLADILSKNNAARTGQDAQVQVRQQGSAAAQFEVRSASEVGTTVDEQGLTWFRCQIGKVWDATRQSCAGNARRFDWKEAIVAVGHFNRQQYLGHSDWRLPTSTDVKSLLGWTGNVREDCPRAKMKSLEVFRNVHDKELFGSNHWLADLGSNASSPLTVDLEVIDVICRSSGLVIDRLAHEKRPIIIVRSTLPSPDWQKIAEDVGVADRAVNRGRATERALVADFNQSPVGKYVHEVVETFAAPARSSASASSPAGNTKSGSVGQTGGKTWVCQVQCRGPLGKLGSRPRVPSVGTSRWDAAENAKSAAEKLCLPEPGISWAEVVRCE